MLSADLVWVCSGKVLFFAGGMPPLFSTWFSFCTLSISEPSMSLCIWTAVLSRTDLSTVADTDCKREPYKTYNTHRTSLSQKRETASHWTQKKKLMKSAFCRLHVYEELLSIPRPESMFFKGIKHDTWSKYILISQNKMLDHFWISTIILKIKTKKHEQNDVY